MHTETSLKCTLAKFNSSVVFNFYGQKRERFVFCFVNESFSPRWKCENHTATRSGRVSHLLRECRLFPQLPSSVFLRRKTALTASFILSVPNGSPSFIGPLPFPLHAKDTAKATAVVFMLFILSQDCVVIYTVNNENTL